jgi:phosphoglycerate-specific signal transduction histidine kinase
MRKRVTMGKNQTEPLIQRGASGNAPAEIAATARNVGHRNEVDAGMRQFDQTLRQLDEALTERVPAEIAALATAERRAIDSGVRRLQCDMLRAEVFGAIAQMTDTLAHELNQPLAAAGFLAKAAGLRLGREASEDIIAARADLDEAAEQILQVGRIIRGLRDHFAEQRER